MTTRITQLTVVPEEKPIFSEQATTVTIQDDSGGEFVVVEQAYADYGKIAIDPKEWPDLRAAIDQMVKECKEEAK
jgi:hypothetical protein